MSAQQMSTVTEGFDAEFKLSVSRLLSMLRQAFRMDLAFIGKFEYGFRTAVFVESGGRGSSARDTCFSHPEDETYCRKIADGDLPTIIPDTRQNEITREMPITRALSIGAYVGVPIVLSDGELYGTLCCLKHERDHSLANRDPSLLKFVAALIAERVETHRESQRRIDWIRGRIEAVTAENQLEMHFQPIWSFGAGGISAYEALARFRTDPYITPDVWFEEAGEVGLRDELESLAITQALSELPNLPRHCSLNINASPETILSGAVGDILTGHDTRRIVLEVTEHSRILDYPEFREAIRDIRQLGVRIAVDDAGSGHASFHHVLELDADMIKLDLSLIRDIQHNVKKQALAAALISYARHTGPVVVAEGVDCQAEFDGSGTGVFHRPAVSVELSVRRRSAPDAYWQCQRF